MRRPQPKTPGGHCPTYRGLPRARDHLADVGGLHRRALPGPVRAPLDLPRRRSRDLRHRREVGDDGRGAACCGFQHRDPEALAHGAVEQHVEGREYLRHLRVVEWRDIIEYWFGYLTASSGISSEASRVARSSPGAYSPTASCGHRGRRSRGCLRKCRNASNACWKHFRWAALVRCHDADQEVVFGSPICSRTSDSVGL